jgi:hypothetical protein
MDLTGKIYLCGELKCTTTKLSLELAMTAADVVKWKFDCESCFRKEGKIVRFYFKYLSTRVKVQ